MILVQTFFLTILDVSVVRDGVCSRDVAVTCVKSPVEDVEVMLRSPGVPVPLRDMKSLILDCIRAFGWMVGVGDWCFSHELVAAAPGVFNVTSALTRMSLRF